MISISVIHFLYFSSGTFIYTIHITLLNSLILFLCFFLFLLSFLLSQPLTHYPIELAEWKTLIDQIDAKIKEMQKLPKSTNKTESITFYSNAASQFRYFRDAYRHHVAHARKLYEEPQAKSIMDRTKEFLESLPPRLLE